jgi:hypothetical protein
MKNLTTNPLYQEIGDELKLGTLHEVDVIQKLWGGYGELVRLRFSQDSIIVKHVKLPKPSSHPRGWNTDISHQRKLHSYQIEVNWYENFSTPSDVRCRVPQGLKCFQTDNEWLIVMEDLSKAGYPVTAYQPTKAQLQASLKWLANFHARYMHTKSDLLWQTGTYWHLETRPDELKVLQDTALKNYAQKIDKALKDAEYQTIVHGDAKLANFCFSEDGDLASAVDFQYVGHGCGMKDLVYFMRSAVEPDECEAMEEWILNTYFNALQEALAHYQSAIDSNKVEQEWRELFSVAWADFQRFIKGWSPDHYKINSYSEVLTSRALSYLRSKT